VLNFKLLLDEEVVRQRAEEGVKKEDGTFKINPIMIPHNKEVTELRPFEFLYAAFDSGEPNTHGV
jgi:hypothetical protein